MPAARAAGACAMPVGEAGCYACWCAVAVTGSRVGIEAGRTNLAWLRLVCSTWRSAACKMLSAGSASSHRTVLVGSTKRFERSFFQQQLPDAQLGSGPATHLLQQIL